MTLMIFHMNLHALLLALEALTLPELREAAMKFQIAFRETSHAVAEHQLWIAVGLVEMDAALAACCEEMFTSVRMEFTNDGIPLCALFTNNIYAATSNGHSISEDLKGSGIEEQLTKQLDRTLPSSFSNAELFLRTTRVATSEGNIVMAFSGLVGYKLPIKIDCDGIYQLASSFPEAFLKFEGRIGTDIHPEWGKPNLIAATRGLSAKSFLRIPTWGFGDEPVQIGSTMHRDVQKMTDRHRALHLSGRSPKEENEYTTLSVALKRDGLNDFGRHPDFEEALRRLIEAGYPTDDSIPLTRKQLSDRSEYLTAVNRELVEKQRLSEISSLAARL
jgi:hypothetical protein